MFVDVTLNELGNVVVHVFFRTGKMVRFILVYIFGSGGSKYV